MLSRPLKLALVDDHTLYRKILKGFLAEQTGLEVVYQSSDFTEFFTYLRKMPVDILVMDLFLPSMTGVEALRLIRQEFPELKVLVVSMNTDMECIGELLDIGINGYLSKTNEPYELLQAIFSIAENRMCRSELLTEGLYRHCHTNRRWPQSTVTLSERERKILQLIWDEKSTKEIADQLFIGVRSVEKVRQDLKEKLGVRSTVGLLKYAISKRIIGAVQLSRRVAD